MEMTRSTHNIFAAARAGKLRELKRLTGKDGDKLDQTSIAKNETLLHVVASNGSKPCAEFIKSMRSELIEKKNKQDDTALHNAARAGHRDLLEYLVRWAEEYDKNKQAGSEDGRVKTLEIQNKDGNTVLHEAVLCGDAEMVEMLMKKDAKLAEINNNKSESPFDLATTKESKEIMLLLWELDQTGSHVPADMDLTSSRLLSSSRPSGILRRVKSAAIGVFFRWP